MRILRLLTCVAFHRPRWRTHRTREQGHFGECSFWHRQCLACGRQWGLFRETPA